MAELAKLPFVLAYTSLNDYLNCPKKFFHKYIGKDAEEKKSYAQNQGISVHDALKARLKLREPLPEQYVRYEGACLDLERLGGDRHVELMMAIDGRGKVCEWGSPMARFRGKADFVAVIQAKGFILDWKNGKTYEDPLELKTLALLLRARFPQIKSITGMFYWLQPAQIGAAHPVIDDTNTTWNQLLGWSDSIARRVENRDWPPDENPLCPWCPCSKAQCQFKKDQR